MIRELDQTSYWHPQNEADNQLVLKQLELVLESAHFRTSKRYPSLLRFVVERTLEGRGGELKERTLGIEIFDRELTYDTHQDPIVRVTAAEVRKRLIGYYQTDGASDRLRIELPSGSYVPNFQLDENRTGLSQPPGVVPAAPPLTAETIVSAGDTIGLATPSDASQQANHPEAGSRSLKNHVRMWANVLAVLVILFGAGYFAYRSYSAPSRNAFWEPLLGVRGPILLCAPALSNLRVPGPHTDLSPRTNLIDATTKFGQMAYSDAFAQTRLGYFLGRVNHEYRVQSSVQATFNDLQGGPDVLIGALSNPWTLRLTSSLRFKFLIDPVSGFSRIIDTAAKTQPGWQIDGSMHYEDQTSDYALVARFRDATTRQYVVVVAGLGAQGTEAAGNFVTDKARTDELLAMAPTGWGKANVAAVLQTQVINGVSGPPKIMETQFW
jgi:hypothetical protein